ncbi:MAG: Cysteine-rich secretory protein family [Bacteroidota bacterium]|nr:Cysteine-rich secretory protein family [Bacteroidota bacterium]
MSKIEIYQRESYFKKKVYEENEWKSFYKLAEADQVIAPNNYDMHLMNAAIFFATNKLRESKNLKSFIFSAELRDAAVVHTQQMIQRNFFDHFNNRAPKLRSPEDRIKLFGVNSSASAENIDLNNVEMPCRISYKQLAEKIVKAFYDSPPHRKILLDKKYQYIGCAAIFDNHDKGGYRYIKTTQDFSAAY